MPMRVEGFVIGAAGVAHGEGGDAQVLQRLNPLLEDRRDGGITLQVDAANLAAAVVEVEVAGNLLRSGFSSTGPAGLRTHSGSFIWSGVVESGT